MSLSKRKREAFSLLLKNGGEDMKSGEVTIRQARCRETACATGVQGRARHLPAPSVPLDARHGVLVSPRRSQRLFDTYRGQTSTTGPPEADIHLRGTLADRSGTRCGVQGPSFLPPPPNADDPFRCTRSDWKPYLTFFDFWATEESDRLHSASSPNPSPQSPSSKTSHPRRLGDDFSSSVELEAYISKPSLYDLHHEAMVDAILRGDMDPSICCSYGQCKGDVVVSVGY
ncbi:uncharacterized protein TRIREDRAFT_109031 [Trichoderma reesei QM6a]|uniref:Predicted protein n=1 Tax=Hypocrea jecorina (strain QM6a) TaxID=431241 RepID=G0RNN7_HYPJQ|nr:uncharacterized protein TRIREDRAFT_109031 [Trichoderma reesei QM6a]EGR47305.1 predicted protein [Trichoderma reesei QM6a]